MNQLWTQFTLVSQKLVIRVVSNYNDISCGPRITHICRQTAVSDVVRIQLESDHLVNCQKILLAQHEILKHCGGQSGQNPRKFNRLTKYFLTKSFSFR